MVRHAHQHFDTVHPLGVVEAFGGAHRSAASLRGIGMPTGCTNQVKSPKPFGSRSSASALARCRPVAYAAGSLVRLLDRWQRASHRIRVEDGALPGEQRWHAGEILTRRPAGVEGNVRGDVAGSVRHWWHLPAVAVSGQRHAARRARVRVVDSDSAAEVDPGQRLRHARSRSRPTSARSPAPMCHHSEHQVSSPTTAGRPRRSAPVSTSTSSSRSKPGVVSGDDVAGDVVQPLVADQQSEHSAGDLGGPTHVRRQAGRPGAEIDAGDDEASTQ